MTQPTSDDVHVDGLTKPKSRHIPKRRKKADEEGDVEKRMPFFPVNVLGLTTKGTLAEAPFDPDAINFGVDPSRGMYGEVCGSCRFYLRDSESEVGRCQILPDDVEVPWFWTSDAYISASFEASSSFEMLMSGMFGEDSSEDDGEVYVEQRYNGKKPRRRRKVDAKKFAKTFYVDFAKVDDEKRVVIGPVLVPDVEDSQGDTVSKEDIEEAAHNFMIMSQEIQRQHNDEDTGVQVVESYIAPQDLELNGDVITKGTWMMGVHIPESRDDIWKAVKSGDLTGFSIRGTGTREIIEA